MTTEEKLLNVIELFSKLCETKQEILELLIPLTSTTLALEIKRMELTSPKDEEYVDSYLTQIKRYASRVADAIGPADGGAEWEKPS